MKKKLMIFVLITLLFSLMVTTLLFMVIANYQYIAVVKEELLLNNRIIGALIQRSPEENVKTILKDALQNSRLRITYIDKNGEVIEDSSEDPFDMENHNDRSEVDEARIKGSGSSFRYSTTLQNKMIYVATDIGYGYIVRTSIPIDYVGVFHGKYLKYYLVTVILVIIMALFLASRVSYIIIKPIKDLEYITGRVAKGELGRRFAVYTNDEIGQLGKTFNDMTEKLQSTIKDSLEKQNRLEAILKSMDSGVIAFDRNYRIIMMNPYAKEIFGIDNDIIGQQLMDSIHGFKFEDVFNNNDDSYREVKIMYPNERILRVKTADIINESEHIGVVAVLHDVTDVKRLENMRTEFVANVSHELKTPLTSIKGFAETLRYVEDEKNKEKFLNIINDEAERLTRLINDILTLSDIEMHKEEKKENIDVVETIKDIYCLMKNTAEKKAITLNIIGSEVARVFGNRDRFKQMLINLVDNAIKYSEHGDSVNIGTRTEGNNCVIWIEDTGAGIPKEHIPRLFERFYRVDKARSRARGGTGLGLAIVKHIIIGFNGTIEVESELGKGSKFTVKIPYARG
jgi:two-component system, OmpR family, phosphate regulon sensor histidine kinase PhoR